jgi:hypothetical protein
MALRVKAGVTLSPGDVVALDKNGEVIKASKVFDPIGIVVQDRNLGLIVKSVSSDGYMGKTVDSIVSVASKRNQGTDPDPIADVKRAMMSDPHLSAVIQSRIDAASKSQTATERHEELNSQVREHASRVIGRALNDALAGQMVGVEFGGMKAPSISFPPLPPRPLPALPTIPTPQIPSITDIIVLGGGSITDIIGLGGGQNAATTQELPIMFGKDGKKTVWVGLLRDDGREVRASEYDRQSVEIDITGTTSKVNFPQACSDWGLITHMAIYEFPDSASPLLTFPTTNSARVTSGTTMSLSNIVIQTTPTGLAPTKRLHLPMEDLSVKGTDKESLKGKMEEARLRLKGLIKP